MAVGIPANLTAIGLQLFCNTHKYSTPLSCIRYALHTYSKRHLPAHDDRGLPEAFKCAKMVGSHSAPEMIYLCTYCLASATGMHKTKRDAHSRY